MTDADVRQNRTPDLSSERLDELEDQWNCEGCIAYDDMLALIAQARRTEQAERDALREHISEARRLLAQYDVSLDEKWDWLDATRQIAQPSDRAHTNDVAPGITMSRTEEMWGASCDWGHCDGKGAGFRWCADLKDWLPVCHTHLAAPHGDAQPTDAGGA